MSSMMSIIMSSIKSKIINRIWNKITNLDIRFKFDRELKSNAFLASKGLVSHLIGTGLSLIPIPKIWIDKRAVRRKSRIMGGLINTGHKLIEIVISNISEKGALIITDMKLNVGQLINVNLKGFSGKAVILWNDSSRAAFGLGFLLSEDGLDR